MLSRFEHGAVVADLDESAASAARRMRDFHVGCVIVVRAARPVGVGSGGGSFFQMAEIMSWPRSGSRHNSAEGV